MWWCTKIDQYQVWCLCCWFVVSKKKSALTPTPTCYHSIFIWNRNLTANVTGDSILNFAGGKETHHLSVTVCKMVHSAWQIAFNSWTDNSTWLLLRRSTSDLEGTLSSNLQESPVGRNFLGWAICLTKTCSGLRCLSSTSSIQRQSLWPIYPWNRFFATVWFLEVNCEGK